MRRARIIREYLVPRFRSGDFDGGIETVAAMVRLVDGEPLPEPWKGTPAGTQRQHPAGDPVRSDRGTGHAPCSSACGRACRAAR